jgi:hypothetical protein
VTVLIAAQRLPANVAAQAREACKALDLVPVDWVRGIPRVAPAVVIGGLAHGERRIPDDLLALLEAAPAVRLVLCAQELLVKPRVVLADGRVCVLGPPIEPAQLEAALREVIAPVAPQPLMAPRLPSRTVPPGRRFEVLRRSHWIAWTRGRTGPAIALHEQPGATVVLGGAARDPSAVAGVMTSAQTDADREAALGVLAGTSGVAHLSHDASEWLMYWPIARCSLWICSPNRAPVCWNAARGIAAVTNRRLLRLPAFPEDQLIAAWSDTPGAEDPLAPLRQVVTEGGSETILGLDDIAGRHEHVTGLVMEVR